ncbi:AraC family transcriptional regulator [Coraliomargarita sp. SDUM461004]|uniref:AraC family transcriptional regulator n=1 Tax=Thalassobacterium sedimentorum TaxID=3041258 RepID=A0ABU1AFZ5_9BACT|nr:AraC family transcriptional regulator [Coraliomargarita sp. SDUM461004]MDQ8193751.1 AraC family transcriptional regulator [Coraliomargarita sp. SDUM461004]
MIIASKLISSLRSVGYYTSPVGGAAEPARIGEDDLFFEIITAGEVYGFEKPAQLHGIGSIFVHKPGDCTVTRSPGQTRYSCLTIRFAYTDLQALVEWPRRFLWNDMNAVLKFSDEMLSAYHHQILDRGIIGDFILNQLRFRLEASRLEQAQDEIPPRLKAVMSYFEHNLSEAISVEDVAEHVGLSASHLHSLFRLHLDQTPHQYLIRARMRAAAHLLVSSDRPIKAIALDVGYVNSESFCRAFKKYYDRTAAAHRKRYRNYDM